MQSFLQSAFLQALGYAIANSLWQVALIWLIVLLVNSIGKLTSAKKYFVSVVAQFTGFAWFIATLQFYYSRCSEVLQQAQMNEAINNAPAYIAAPEVSSFSSALLYATIKMELLLPYLSVAYLFMLLFLSVRFIRAFYFTREIRYKGLHKPDIDLRLFIKRTAAYLGIKKEVSIYISDLVKSPLTIGFLKPLILIPVASLNHLSADQMEAVLLHELAHIKRADYLVNIIQSFIEITLFFNPFVQLLGKTIKHERENSCDDWVLQFQYNPAMYAEALLRIAYVQTGTALTMNATGNKGDLLPRVKRMLNQQQDKSHRYRNQVFSLLLITIMLSTVAWLQPVPKNNNLLKNTSANQHKIVIEPLTASVDNPLFNPIYFFAKPMQKEIDKAVAIAQEQIDTAVPATIEKTANIIADITPALLKSLQDITLQLGNEIVKPQPPDAEADANTADGNNHEDATFSLGDTANFTNAIAELVQKEINKTDWKKVDDDLGKIQLNISDLQKEKFLNAASGKINEVLNKSLEQLQQLKTETNTAVILQQKKNAKKLAGAAKKLELKIQNSKEIKAAQLIEEKLREHSAPAKNDGGEEKETGFLSPNLPANEAVNIARVYNAAAYNNMDYTYRFEDTAQDLNSAIIIVKHNPTNDYSHTKHITVEITGNNGTVKKYEFSVEVYQ